jgi:peptidoglycan/LPS O-acetylase OafA/YrhL
MKFKKISFLVRFRKYKIACMVLLLALFLLPSIIYAAGGGKPATKIYNVADTRAMEPGLSKWIADIYNSNLWLYGGVIVLIMASMGLIIGLGMDKVVGLLGINLGKLDHHE